MIESPEGRRTLTPQLAVRVAVIGSFALAMFAIIFFRLWFLQVLSGSTYLAQAHENQTRTLPINAARGDVLDRGGQRLVTSIAASAVEISPQDLPVPLKDTIQYLRPPAPDMAVYRKLAGVLGMSTARARCHVDLATTTLQQLGFTGRKPQNRRLAPIPCLVAQKLSQVPYSFVTIKAPVNQDVHFYLAERQSQFPGVVVQQVFIRQYPFGDLGAQLFGTVGPISCVSKTSCELHQKHFKGVSRNAIVGQSGLEYQYDQWLRGTPGSETVQVNALGQSTGEVTMSRPVTGENLKLSIDSKLERVGQNALAESMNQNAGGLTAGGSFVAMDPQSGEVYAMGSLPSFDPSLFTKPISTAQYNSLFGPQAGSPQLNRAIQSAGPTGSTFKMITATAALQSGRWGLGQTYDDTGQFCEGGGLCRRNAGGAAYGVLDIVGAIRVSDDVFFYNLGALLNSQAPNGGALQAWARKYGIGRSTGIDLPGEATGTLPDAAWRAKRNGLEAECDNATGPFRGRPKHSPGGCGIADGTNRPWSQGDDVNLAVGQGDVQVTPLQLAVAYSTLANGGTVVTPHVGLDVQSADGTVLQRISPGPRRRIPLSPIYRTTIMQGLHEAAQSSGGTSYDVMGNFPETVYGKTGTAQYISPTSGEVDTGWYACFVPASATSKPIVVVVTVAKGGYGDIAAAPVAHELLSQWFFGKPGAYKAGTSATL
jgi:penicillin-binding protein 2